ncbi:lysophospholipase A [Aureobasidium namibiae CBS 147.97]|uniref:Lysophospholipase A n=1 Tax=Aureobasidium namibiae CBS 147.97 TaxID=1043004 RepID=A0A074X344_9PEZI
MLIKPVLGLAGLGATAPSAPSSSLDIWANTSNIIAFGDSYSYVLGTAGRQNYSFIGDYNRFAFSAQKLLNNKIVQSQTSTAEGGPNWLEHLTGCGVNPGTTSPLDCNIQLWDFAFAGADIGTQYTPRHKAYTVPLVNQTQQFLTYAQPALHNITTPETTLATFWIGTNDIFDTSTSKVPIDTLYTDMITTLYQSIQTIHDAGYRNFLIMNLAPLDKTPKNVRSIRPLPSKSMVNRWNTILASQAADFRTRNSDSNVVVFDSNTFLNEILKNPAPYGIKNTKDFCAAWNQPNVVADATQYGCLPMDQYFWFNTAHLTTHTHEILAAEVKRVLSGGS